MKTERLSVDQILEAAEFLRKGELVAFPTETVYGLGASVFNSLAIQKIFQVKGRPADNPLIAHVSRLEELEAIAVDLPPLFFRLAERFFPGPLTVVLRRHPAVPGIVSAGLPSIAVRMPAHPIAQQLIAAVGTPLVAPSANRSGKPSATLAEHVLEDFDGQIAAVIDHGATEIGIESTVVSLLGEEIVLLRPGAIVPEAIEAVAGQRVVLYEGSREVVASPGMKYRHYAPEAVVRLFFEEAELLAQWEEGEKGRMRVLSRAQIPGVPYFGLSAQSFYAQLRAADRAGAQAVWVLCDAEVRRDLGLMNRISRSSL